MPDQNKSADIFGIRPIAEAISKVTGAAVDGASAVLSRICLPAAEEIGLMLRDKVKIYRAEKLRVLLEKTNAKLADNHVSSTAHAEPRLVFKITEEASWVEDTYVQDWWAGLLVSSCTEEGDDDGNLIFVNILSNLTKSQARILNYACKVCSKTVTPTGLVQSGFFPLTVEFDVLTAISGVTDHQRLDRELDHLRSLDLIGEEAGLSGTPAMYANISPTALALHLFVRCQGSRLQPYKYFGLDVPVSEEALAGSPIVRLIHNDLPLFIFEHQILKDGTYLEMYFDGKWEPVVFNIGENKEGTICRAGNVFMPVVDGVGRFRYPPVQVEPTNSS